MMLVSGGRLKGGLYARVGVTLVINFDIIREERRVVIAVVRTTLTLPAELLDRVDQAVRQGQAHSRNAFVAAALERDFAAQEQAALDAQFAAMAEDKEYLAEGAQLEAEFAGASVEALRLAEGRV